MFFKSVNEAILAYENGYITLHSQIKVRVTKTLANGAEKTGTIDATLGRLLFNEIIPQDLGFVDREVEGNELKMEIDFHVGKKQLKQILEKVINTHGATQTAEVLDDVKAIGYKFSTRAAMTVSISDMTVPPQKPELIAKLSKMNAAVMGSSNDPFYGAPTVLIVLADPEIGTYHEDGSLVMGNLMLAAHAVGVDSCWIHRAKEEFESAEGKELLKEWGLPENLVGIGHCILGYRDCEYPEAKERKANYIVRV